MGVRILLFSSSLPFTCRSCVDLACVDRWPTGQAGCCSNVAAAGRPTGMVSRGTIQRIGQSAGNLRILDPSRILRDYTLAVILFTRNVSNRNNEEIVQLYSI